MMCNGSQRILLQRGNLTKSYCRTTFVRCENIDLFVTAVIFPPTYMLALDPLNLLPSSSQLLFPRQQTWPICESDPNLGLK